MQYSAINQCHCVKASMTVHEEIGYSLVHYCAINKSHCVEASMTGHEENRLQVQCSAVLQINLTLSRPP